MSKLDGFSRKTYYNFFVKITQQQRHDLLLKLDNEQKGIHEK